MEIASPRPEERAFNDARRRYFIRLGVQLLDDIRMHRDCGQLREAVGEKVIRYTRNRSQRLGLPLTEGDRPARSQSFRNVTEHCLVEAARAQAIASADFLNLNTLIANDLRRAAVLHDVNKKNEIEMIRTVRAAVSQESEAERRKAMWDVVEREQRHTAEWMRKHSVAGAVVEIANGAGHLSLPHMEFLLSRKKLDEYELAQLAMHFIDDVTVDAEWARPAEESGGVLKNDLDRRMDNNEANKNYQDLNSEGKNRWGEMAFTRQRRVGHLVEERLIAEIERRTGTKIPPRRLAETLDQAIREKICEGIEA